MIAYGKIKAEKTRNAVVMHDDVITLCDTCSNVTRVIREEGINLSLI